MLKYRKHIRLPDFDYSSNGAYFVTVCSDFRSPFLSGNILRIVERDLKALEARFSGVFVDYYVVMKDHLHVVFLFCDASIALSRVIQAFKSLTTIKAKRIGFSGKRLWQPNYYEHIIRSEKSLEKIRKYIEANPYAVEIDWEEVDPGPIPK